MWHSPSLLKKASSEALPGMREEESRAWFRSAFHSFVCQKKYEKKTASEFEFIFASKHYAKSDKDEARHVDGKGEFFAYQEIIFL